MRFRISTLFLVVALICVMLGWANSELKRQAANTNGLHLVSEVARNNAFVQTYRSLEGAKLTASQDRMRRLMLQNIVKSTPHLLSLPKTKMVGISREDYQKHLKRTAREALLLLDVYTPADFEAKIIFEGELGLMKMFEKDPQIVYYEVLDKNTNKLTPAFEAFLHEMVHDAVDVE